MVEILRASNKKDIGERDYRQDIIKALLRFKQLYHYENSIPIERFGSTISKGSSTVGVDGSNSVIDFTKLMLPRNSTLAMLASILGYNVMFIGDPGMGKSTLAKKLIAVLFGIPYDAMSALEIRGHPQATEEKIVGRFDYGALQAGDEKVIFNMALTL
ncbi:MAG: AAA family ATPase, partial [Candidatus Anstonellales archaeon]